MEYIKQLLETRIDWSFLSRIPTWMLVVTPILYAYYKYSTWYFDTFKKLGIKGPKPWPIFGTSWGLIKNGIVGHDMEMKKYGNVVGTFQGRRPMMMIYDVEILKQVMIKEFSNFTNRFAPPLDEYPMRKLLTMLKDEQWKRVRNVMTPTFSSGKLRKMNKQIQLCAETLIANLQSKAEKNEIFDFRELCGAYTMDVIASTAFSMKIDSHNDPNNQFVTMGKKAFTFSFKNPKMLIFFFFPFLAKPMNKLGLSFFPNDVIHFFVNVVNQAMKKRGHDGQKNVDFLQLMINAQVDGHEGSDKQTEKAVTETETTEVKHETSAEKGLSHEEILAQGLLFFLAGFETTANTLSLLAYSLATNPECQDKLLKEIDEVMKDTDHPDYDLVKSMPYLDMCLSETLRLYPAGARTDREAANDITINGLFIPKGMLVGSPIYVLHMDPEVWPNPTQFIPERFTAEEKEARNPYYYMPFGVGPRNCVGMRLALAEIKISAATILKKLKFVACPETEVPLKLDPIRMKAVNGVKLLVERRHL